MMVSNNLKSSIMGEADAAIGNPPFQVGGYLTQGTGGSDGRSRPSLVRLLRLVRLLQCVFCTRAPVLQEGSCKTAIANTMTNAGARLARAGLEDAAMAACV
jgi:hypothetical protein